MCAPAVSTFVGGRRIVWLAAFLSCVSVAVCQTPPTNRAADRLEVVWKKRGADGRDLGAASELNVVVTSPVAGQKGEKKDKPTRDGGKVPGMFLDDVVYHGELPTKVRQGVTFIHFALDATANASPEDGTLINIDGAVLGYKATRDETTGRGTAELVTMDMTPDGKSDWKGTGYYFMLGPQGGFTGAPTLCVKVDSGNGTWTLYARDIIIRENLPLLTTEALPTISVRAGRVGDAAVLLDLKVADAPPTRNPAYVKSLNGRVDLAKAHQEGHPNVRTGGERFPDSPTHATPNGGK